VVLTDEMKGYVGRIFDLETGRVARVKLETDESGELTVIMPGFEKDIIILLER